MGIRNIEELKDEPKELNKTKKPESKYVRKEIDTGRCESCNGLHSDCGEA